MNINYLFAKITLLFFFCICLSNSYTENNPDYNFNKLGEESADNTLVEYASMSCIHCANFHNNELPKIKSTLIDRGKLRFIYKDFPLDRPAMYASMVAHCFTGDQYFEVLSSLYRNQKKWVIASENSGNFYSTLHNILKIHDITLDKIIECVDAESDINKKKWDKILLSRLEGQKIGVNSTPTFFLNGKKLEKPVNYELINELIK